MRKGLLALGILAALLASTPAFAECRVVIINQPHGAPPQVCTVCNVGHSTIINCQ